MPSASLRYVAHTTLVPSGSSATVGIGLGEGEAVGVTEAGVSEVSAVDGVAGEGDLDLSVEAGAAGPQVVSKMTNPANEHDAAFLVRPTHGSMGGLSSMLVYTAPFGDRPD